MITVFFDGKCSLCQKEIQYYQRIADEKVFIWVDVTESPPKVPLPDIDLVTALQVLHVIDHQGSCHQGIDGFIVIWGNLRLWKPLAWLAKLPGLYHCLKGMYYLFAKARFKRLAHCQIALKQQTEKKDTSAYP